MPQREVTSRRGWVRTWLGMLLSVISLTIAAAIGFASSSSPWQLTLVGIAAVGIIASGAGLLTTGSKEQVSSRTEERAAEVKELEGFSAPGYSAEALNTGNIYSELDSAAARLDNAEPHLRLATLQRIAAIADRSKSSRQECIDLICAYLRFDARLDGEDRPVPAVEQEVRRTLLSLVVRRLRPGADISWVGSTFDLHGAYLFNADFSGVSFIGSDFDFSDATFAGKATFINSRFGEHITFQAANFDGSTISFHGSVFSNNARFSGTSFRATSVDFTRTSFAGEVADFTNSSFEAEVIDFRNSRFDGGLATFSHAHFHGRIRVDFESVQLSANTVIFDGSHFETPWVDFTGTTIGGELTAFRDAAFDSPKVDFAKVTLLEPTVIRFDNARVLTLDGFDGPFRRAVPSLAQVNLMVSDQLDPSDSRILELRSALTAQGIAAPWALLGTALAFPGKGSFYVGDDVRIASIIAIEKGLSEVAKAAKLNLALQAPVLASWWRRFRTAIALRVGPAELDTLKRAGEVQALDRWEAPAAKAYAEAISTLTQSVNGIDHVYFVAKNVILVKTVTGEGKSVVAARVLTSTEMNQLERGDLRTTLANPDSALEFIRCGQGIVTDPSVLGLERIESGDPPSSHALEA